jgi:acyl-coenzyme A thioesterase PaaI-like protein
MMAGSSASRTHLAINAGLCGTPRQIEPGRAVVDWSGGAETVADARGLIHGGFVFGLADYAAMLAVNEPNVVLAAAEIRFLAPVEMGEPLTAEASIAESEGRKHRVEVEVRRQDTVVMTGSFRCVVTPRHVLGEAE